MKEINLETILSNKQYKIITTEEALKDVEPNIKQKEMLPELVGAESKNK